MKHRVRTITSLKFYEKNVLFEFKQKSCIFLFCVLPLLSPFKWFYSYPELALVLNHGSWRLSRKVLGWQCRSREAVTQSRWGASPAFLCPHVFSDSWCLMKTPVETVISSLKLNLQLARECTWATKISVTQRPLLTFDFFEAFAFIYFTFYLGTF